MFRITLIVLLLAGCVQLPPTPQDLRAKNFDSVPGKAVIYVVRAPMDSSEASSLALDDREQITTFGGTYYRWEVIPGAHRIAGVGPANESITLTTAPGNIYFIEHNVRGTRRAGVQSTSIRQINEQEGRVRVLQSQHL